MSGIKNVLSLSGGGVKGFQQAEMVREFEEQTGQPLYETFQVIAGTSVGGLLACAIASGIFTGKQLLELFEETAANIFPQHWYHVGKIGQIFSHKYSQKPFKELLDKYFGDMMFEDMKCRVLITTFEANKENPIKIFDSHNAPGIKVKDVILATTAAPSYFKSVTIKDEDGDHILVDGGVGYNRPAAEVLKHLKQGLSFEQQKEKEMLENLKMVSLNFQSPHEEKKVLPPHLDGILPQLANGLVSDIMKAAQSGSTVEVERDLPREGQFVNLLLPVPKGSTKLDNSSPKNMAKLKAASTKYIEDNKEFIENLCKDLVKNAKAMEENLKAANISNVSSALVASDNTNEEQDNNASSTVSNRVISKECDKQQLLIKDLNDSQYETLQKGLSTLTPRESQLLEMFLQVLDNTQIEALSGRISSIINGNHMKEIPELTNSQNMLLSSFSKMFIPDNDYASLSNTCGQEALAQEVLCDGRGSDFSHAPPEVY